MNYTEVLKECIKIAEERQEHYGEATSSLELTSELLDLAFGLKLSISDICKVLVSLKLSREKFKFKKDSLLDIINYISIMIYNEENKK